MSDLRDIGMREPLGAARGFDPAVGAATGVLARLVFSPSTCGCLASCTEWSKLSAPTGAAAAGAASGAAAAAAGASEGASSALVDVASAIRRRCATSIREIHSDSTL